jgi:hypothetical protein
MQGNAICTCPEPRTRGKMHRNTSSITGLIWQWWRSWPLCACDQPLIMHHDQASCRWLYMREGVYSDRARVYNLWIKCWNSCFIYLGNGRNNSFSAEVFEAQRTCNSKVISGIGPSWFKQKRTGPKLCPGHRNLSKARSPIGEQAIFFQKSRRP